MARNNQQENKTNKSKNTDVKTDKVKTDVIAQLQADIKEGRVYNVRSVEGVRYRGGLRFDKAGQVVSLTDKQIDAIKADSRLSMDQVTDIEGLDLDNVLLENSQATSQGDADSSSSSSGDESSSSGGE